MKKTGFWQVLTFQWARMKGNLVLINFTGFLELFYFLCHSYEWKSNLCQKYGVSRIVPIWHRQFYIGGQNSTLSQKHGFSKLFYFLSTSYERKIYLCQKYGVSCLLLTLTQWTLFTEKQYNHRLRHRISLFISFSYYPNSPMMRWYGPSPQYVCRGAMCMWKEQKRLSLMTYKTTETAFAA